MSQKEIYIHIGAPKTATTLLQQALNKNRNALQAIGYDVLLPGQIRNCGFYKYIFAKHTNQITNVTLDEAKNDFALQLKHCQNNKVIISEEGFSQHLMPSDLTNKGFAGMRQSLAATKAIVPDNTSIVLSIRNQIDFIESTYKHKIKWKFCSLSFEGFLNKHIDMLNISWAKVVKTIEEFFPNKVRVVPFELIHLSDSHYLNCFFEAFQIENQKDLFFFSSRVENESLADNHAVFMRSLNKSIKDLESFSKSTRPNIKIKFTKELLENEPKRRLQEFKIPTSQARQVKNYYHTENIQILMQYCSKENFEFVKKYY